MTEHEQDGADETSAPEDIRGAISAALNGGGATDSQSAEVDDQAQSARVPAKVWKERHPSPPAAELRPKLAVRADESSANGSTGRRRSASEKAISAPSEWRTSQKEVFKSLPEAAQRFLVERHNAMEADYNSKTEAIADLKRDHDAIDALFAPYRQTMQARGITPRHIIESWAQIERRLGQGDGVSVIKGIVEGYGIDPAKIAAALGVSVSTNEQPSGDRRGGNTPRSLGQPPSQIELVLAEIGAIKERLSADDRARSQAARAAEESARRRRIAEMEKFKSETDEHGNLLHPYAPEVENDMLDWVHVAQARGQEAPPLRELYERAVRANPSTYRALRLAEQQSAMRQKQEEISAKTAAAKRAASSVIGAPGPGGPPDRSSARNLREEIRAQVDGD